MIGICCVCQREKKVEKRREPSALAGKITCKTCYWHAISPEPCLICEEIQLLVARTEDGVGVCQRCLREYVNLGNCSRCGKQNCGVVKLKNSGLQLCRSCANNKAKSLRTRPCMGCRIPLPALQVKGQRDPLCRLCFLKQRGRTGFTESHRQSA